MWPFHKAKVRFILEWAAWGEAMEPIQLRTDRAYIIEFRQTLHQAHRRFSYPSTHYGRMYCETVVHRCEGPSGTVMVPTHLATLVIFTSSKKKKNRTLVGNPSVQTVTRFTVMLNAVTLSVIEIHNRNLVDCAESRSDGRHERPKRRCCDRKKSSA